MKTEARNIKVGQHILVDNKSGIYKCTEVREGTIICSNANVTERHIMKQKKVRLVTFYQFKDEKGMTRYIENGFLLPPFKIPNWAK